MQIFDQLKKNKTPIKKAMNKWLFFVTDQWVDCIGRQLKALLKRESTNEEMECFANYFFAAMAFTNLIKKPH